MSNYAVILAHIPKDRLYIQPDLKIDAPVTLACRPNFATRPSVVHAASSNHVAN